MEPSMRQGLHRPAEEPGAMPEQNTPDNCPLARIFEAEKKMQDYYGYIEELHHRYPETYHTLWQFIDRENCRCRKSGPCHCTSLGMLCQCPKPNGQKTKTCRYCTNGMTNCQPRTMNVVVRVYDIHPKAQTFEEFFVRKEYHVKDEVEFKMLKCKLYDHNEPEEEEPESADDSDDSWRLVTVNHLSAKVARLLGGTYDIHADFFNRFLPGTQAISGRLISRLPSSVQIDFDELYESTQEFNELWKGCKIEDGHKFIGKAMEQNFLIRNVGWDYFPVEQNEWKQSKENSKLSKGYEVMMQDQLKNVFQFNLNHRISIYSRPLSHPRTGKRLTSSHLLTMSYGLTSIAIILFYPKLPICSKKEHYVNGEHVVAQDTNDCKMIEFRAIPDTVQKMSEIHITGQSHKAKHEYASAFDSEFQLHVQEHWGKVKKQRQQQPSLDRATGQVVGGNHVNGSTLEELNLVHLFAVPLFQIVAANWARLIVRREFDLDLLEWRPKELITSRTIEETKSRRVAVTRHQRHIGASVDILKELMAEDVREKVVQKLGKEDVAQTSSQVATTLNYNKGRSNGFVKDPAGEDSWTRVFYDFFELKESLNAMEKRADKIQEGMVGLIDVREGEESKRLNRIALSASVILLPFTVVGTVFGITFSKGGPKLHIDNFLEAMGVTFIVTSVLYAFLWLWDWSLVTWLLRTTVKPVTDRLKLEEKAEGRSLGPPFSFRKTSGDYSRSSSGSMA